MKRNKKNESEQRIERAKAFVRDTLAESAGQQLDEDTLNSVARKIVRSLPSSRDNERKAAA